MLLMPTNGSAMRKTIMRNIMAALLAAFLAVSTAPVMAADRPVGPETGQARVGGDGDINRGPDDAGSGNNQFHDELGWLSTCYRDRQGRIRCYERTWTMSR